MFAFLRNLFPVRRSRFDFLCYQHQKAQLLLGEVREEKSLLVAKFTDLNQRYQKLALKHEETTSAIGGIQQALWAKHTTDLSACRGAVREIVRRASEARLTNKEKMFQVNVAVSDDLMAPQRRAWGDDAWECLAEELADLVKREILRTKFVSL